MRETPRQQINHTFHDAKDVRPTLVLDGRIAALYDPLPTKTEHHGGLIHLCPGGPGTVERGSRVAVRGI